jgi:hypothetical protein
MGYAHTLEPLAKTCPGLTMLSKLVHVAVRVVIAGALLWMIATVPLPPLDWQLVVAVRVPIAVFLFIVYVGKLLYDTFFYERQP